MTKIVINGEELIISGAGSSMANYPKNEQVIGTWIDGKPIYRLVAEDVSLPSASGGTDSLFTQYGLNALSIDTLIYHQENFKTAGGSEIQLPYGNFSMDDSGNVKSWILMEGVVTKSALKFSCFGISKTSSWFNSPARAILIYTKTTDQATR